MSIPFNLKPGDLIQFQKPYYTHWAVYIYNNHIVHVQPPEGGGGKRGAYLIELDSIADYLTKNPVTVIAVNNSFDKTKKPLDRKQIVRRAESRIGLEWDYDLLSNNCEHFAHWCRYGVKVCKQSPNSIKYEDEDGNTYYNARVGGNNLGPVDVKVLSYTDVYEKSPGRRERVTGGELASVGIAYLSRTSIGLDVRSAAYNDEHGLGFKSEVKFVEGDLGPINCKMGVGVSTGIDTKDGLKAELLGTGFHANSEKLELKVLGTSMAVTYPWKWFG